MYTCAFQHVISYSVSVGVTDSPTDIYKDFEPAIHSAEVKVFPNAQIWCQDVNLIQGKVGEKKLKF